jgi:hypothetical protein
MMLSLGGRGRTVTGRRFLKLAAGLAGSAVASRILGLLSHKRYGIIPYLSQGITQIATRATAWKHTGQYAERRGYDR